MRMGWIFFRADNYRNDGDPCWSAGVRRDLRAMAKEQRKNWLALLDANNHSYQHAGYILKPAEKLLARFDRENFEASLDRWTQALESADPAHLSDTGLTLLNYLLRLCRARPELRVDEPLYRIASAKWKLPGPDDWWGVIRSRAWLADYLLVLPTRPPSKAFACVEALTMNPATKDFAEVDKMYQSLLHASSSAAVPQTAPVAGIDGFIVAPGHVYAAEHALIDLVLRNAHPDTYLNNARMGLITTGADSRQPLRESTVQQCAGNLSNLVLALAERVAWIVAHRADYSDAVKLHWCVETGNLLGDALGKMREASLDVLIAALKADGSNFFGYSPSWRIFELCQIYVTKHGWNAELVAAMNPWIKTQHGTNSAQDIRRKAEWMFWFEDISPIKPDECWSTRIRQNLRDMPAEERTLWLPVLMNASFAVADKPPAKWLKPAKAAFAKLEPGQFRDRYRAWFQPFHDGEPLRLSSPGVHLLRLLIWYAMVAEDPSVDEALAWFADAQWKTKDAASRSAKAETAFAYVMVQRNPAVARDAFERILQSGRAYQGSKIDAAYQDLCRRFGTSAITPPVGVKPGPDLEALKANLHRKMKETLSQQLGAGCTWEQDTLVIPANGETYRIDSRSGRIIRASDGAAVRLEIPYDQMPYKVFRDQIDSHDLNHPGEPNLMRTMMCAQILRRGAQPGVQIVVDTAVE
jgi:hypothetical protein